MLHPICDFYDPPSDFSSELEEEDSLFNQQNASTDKKEETSANAKA